MVSFAYAWVLVSIAKNYSKTEQKETNMDLSGFVVTGAADCCMVISIVIGIVNLFG